MDAGDDPGPSVLDVTARSKVRTRCLSQGVEVRRGEERMEGRKGGWRDKLTNTPITSKDPVADQSGFRINLHKSILPLLQDQLWSPLMMKSWVNCTLL